MQVKFRAVLAILSVLPSTALAACYLGKPAWTDLATEGQLFKAFRISCKRLEGKHKSRASTCDPASGDITSKDGGSYFLSIKPYAEGEWELSADTCLLFASELRRMCDHGGSKNITAGWNPKITALVTMEPQLGCCGC